jgi:hypothetical protein
MRFRVRPRIVQMMETGPAGMSERRQDRPKSGAPANAVYVMCIMREKRP